MFYTLVKVHSQVEMGKELINSKTAQLQEDKNLATILLEAVQVQIKLLEQHQDFYKELNLVKTDLENSRQKTNSLVTDMNCSNVQNRSDQLQKIKITFSQSWKFFIKITVFDENCDFCENCDFL